MLEVEVGRVDRRAHETGKDAVEVAAGEAAGGQQPLFGEGKQGHVPEIPKAEVKRGWGSILGHKLRPVNRDRRLSSGNA